MGVEDKGNYYVDSGDYGYPPTNIRVEVVTKVAPQETPKEPAKTQGSSVNTNGTKS